MSHKEMAALLLKGMIAGVAAAFIGFLAARFWGEPLVNLAIAYEKAHDHTQRLMPASGHDIVVVSRAVQAGWGLLTAVVMYGAAFGGLFSVVFAQSAGHFRGLSPRPFALLIAVVGAVVFVIAPALYYPPNPPAVGRPETIGVRTAAYFGFIVLSVSYAMVSLLVAQQLQRLWGAWNAIVTGVGLYVAFVALSSVFLPSFQEVPNDFPAVVLWRFREVSIGVQIGIWLGLGLLFGPLAARQLDRASGVRR